MTKQRALMKRAEWLAYCLEIGFTKDQLPELEKVWDTYKDEYGNMRPVQPTPQPERGNEDILVKALEEAQHHLDTWPDEPSRAIRLVGKCVANALSSYRTSLQGLSGKEIGHYEYDKENEDFKIVVKGEEQDNKQHDFWVDIGDYIREHNQDLSGGTIRLPMEMLQKYYHVTEKPQS